MKANVDTQALESLVHQAAGGDHDAQERLLRMYWPLLHSVVRSQRQRAGYVLRGREETVDAVQEAAVRILRELGKQRWQGRSAFIGWLCALGRAQVIDQARHHGAKKRGVAAQLTLDEQRAWADVPGVETWLDNQQRLEKLRGFLSELTDEQRTALLLNHLGYSHAEVGEVLGVSDEAARKQIARARARLTTLMAKDDAAKNG